MRSFAAGQSIGTQGFTAANSWQDGAPGWKFVGKIAVILVGLSPSDGLS